jgi:hypothetical protein
MTRYRIIYWKHIPSAISLQGDDGREIKVQLPERFQKAIDAYAMATGETDTDAYMAAWRRGDWMERQGTPEQVAAALLSELETAFAKIEIPRRKA